MRATRSNLALLATVACVVALLAAACGGGTSSATKAPTSPAGSATATSSTGAGAVTQPAAGATPLAGLSVDSLNCDTFPGGDVLHDVQTIAPKTTLTQAKTESNSSSVLVCDYDLLGHETAVGHDVSIVVTMSDSLFTGDPSYDESTNKDAFDKSRDHQISTDVTGDATSDTQTVVFSVSGVGAEAYFNDYYTRDQTDHSNEGVRSYLSILRDSSPYLVDIHFSYTPRPDSDEAVTPVDGDPFQNDSKHDMLTAIAMDFLAKLDAATLNPPVATSVTPTTSPVSTGAATSVPVPSDAKVKVRVVNLYAPSTQPAGVPIEGYFQRDASPSPQPGVDAPDIASLGYAQVSDYVDAPDLANGELFIYAAGTTDMLQFQNLDGANYGRYTIVIFNSPGDQIGLQTYSEAPTAVDLAQQLGLPAAPDGQVLLIGDGAGLDIVTPLLGFTLGLAGGGCLTPFPDDGFNIPSGGGSINYAADPGTLQLAYYDSLDSDCSQVPIVGPTNATLAAGDRAYVLPYGLTQATLQLLIVPIPVMAGDPPLEALPTPTAEPAGSGDLPDPCTLLSADDVSAALGEPSTDTQGGGDSGGCSYSGANSQLTIALQPDIDASIFATLAASFGATDPVEGVGDAAFLGTGPVNSIYVLKGTTLLGITLSRHLDTGQDDSTEDAEILKSLAATAVAALP